MDGWMDTRAAVRGVSEPPFWRGWNSKTPFKLQTPEMPLRTLSGVESPESAALYDHMKPRRVPSGSSILLPTELTLIDQDSLSMTYFGRWLLPAGQTSSKPPTSSLLSHSSFSPYVSVLWVLYRLMTLAGHKLLVRQTKNVSNLNMKDDRLTSLFQVLTVRESSCGSVSECLQGSWPHKSLIVPPVNWSLSNTTNITFERLSVCGISPWIM